MSVQNGSQQFARRPWGCLGALVLGPLLVALLGAVVVFRQDLFPDQPAPERLPAPPAAAERLAGVNSPGFFYSVVAIEAADGLTYWYQSFAGWEAWPADSTGVDWAAGGDCDPRARRELTAVAGPLVDCASVQEVGEWCPGALAAYALADDGSLWLQRQLRPCTLAFTTSLCGCLPFAAIVGAVLGLFVWAGVRSSAKKPE